MLTKEYDGETVENTKMLIDSIRKFVYDDSEWTTGDYSKEANQQLKVTQRNLKFYFEQWELRKKADIKRYNKFLREMRKKYND